MEQILHLVAADGPVFLLVFFRITGVLMLAPVFGSAMTPPTLKIFL